MRGVGWLMGLVLAALITGCSTPGSAEGVSSLVPRTSTPVVPRTSTSADGTAKPNLKVSQGSLRVRHGRQQGSFIVVNSGYAGSAASTARLRARVDKKMRVIGFYRIPALVAGGAQRIAIDIPFVRAEKPGRARALVCVDVRREVRESSENDNCHDMGQLQVVRSPQGTAPTDPIAFRTDTIFTVADRVGDKQSSYYIVVPDAYDRTHRTPTSLLVWLHGCAGKSKDEIYTPSPAVRDGTPRQNWISIAPAGRESGIDGSDGCWLAGVDEPKVLAAIRNVETHFNIDRHRVVIGGFSSGGVLAYRTIFDHSALFAGILAEGTLPFGEESGLTQQQAIGEATYEFPIVQVAHLQDDAYPIADVRAQTDALRQAGFPMTRVEREGPHSAGDSGDTGTGHDAAVYLFPHMYDGWRSP